MQNMRHKKLAAMLLTLVMALSLLTVTAFAEGSEAKIGGAGVCNFRIGCRECQRRRHHYSVARRGSRRPPLGWKIRYIGFRRIYPLTRRRPGAGAVC